MHGISTQLYVNYVIILQILFSKNDEGCRIIWILLHTLFKYLVGNNFIKFKCIY